MSFFSQLFAGLKTAVPKNKKNNKGKYEEEYEEEELDEQDRELYQLNREITLKAKKNKESLNDFPPIDDVRQDKDDYLDIPDDSLRYDVEPLDLGLDEPNNANKSDLSNIYDEPLDKEDLDINVQGASAKPAFSVLNKNVSDTSSPVYTRNMKPDDNSDYDNEEDIEDNTDEGANKKGNVFSSFIGRLRKKKENDGSSVSPPAPQPSKVEIKKESKQKKNVAVDVRQLGLLIVLLIMFFGMGYMIFGGQNNEEEVAENPAPTEEKQEEQTASTTIINEKDSIFVNPFIDSAKLAEFAKKTNPATQNGDNPTNSSPGATSSSGALPAIPGNFPKPNLPAFNPPALPSDGGSGMAGAGGGPVKVTGVMTGSDGSGIAILSDGSVVSAGESYQDGRIAFIGGDGIHFEDGKVMEYKD